MVEPDKDGVEALNAFYVGILIADKLLNAEYYSMEDVWEWHKMPKYHAPDAGTTRQKLYGRVRYYPIQVRQLQNEYELLRDEGILP